MKGNIHEIYKNPNSGLIYGEDMQYYYFNARSLLNCNIRQIDEGDGVEFEKLPRRDNQRYELAVNVRKRAVSMSSSSQAEVTPGINPNVTLDHFNSEEKMVIDVLKDTFYVTNGGSQFKVSGSTYRYCLIKPTPYFSTFFKLSRELIVVFSDYVEFEPRSLDASSIVVKKIESKLRLERGCYVLISNDSQIEYKIAELLKDTNLNSIIIPFSYYEFVRNNTNDIEIKNRFKKYLFDVDLFYESKPIEEDIFFFGRRDFAQDITTKCKCNAHCGVFGLRRSGKTSLLYAIRRLLDQEEYISAYIPCNSELARLSWSKALFKLVDDVRILLNLKVDLHKEDEYKENASIFFEEDMNRCLSIQPRPIILMFDEIEYITFGSMEAIDDWKNGKAFIAFWNAVRGYCLKYPSHISIVIAGTNPIINECPSINISGYNKTNPMFGQLSQSNQGAYLPPFSIDNTSTMINTLGGYMGISFSEQISAKITCDCGGHPYLIRLLCKRINQYIQKQNLTRPLEVSLAIYERVRPAFEKSTDAQGFYAMILLILQESFPLEYGVLKILATQGDDLIASTQDHNSLMHLLGYGLIDCNQGKYAIKFETVKRFLQGQYQFEVEGLDATAKNTEIQLRCNNAEVILRKLIRQILLAVVGIVNAKEIIIDAMENNPASSRYVKDAEKLDYSELFDPSVNNGLFLSVLRDVILKNFQYFTNIFQGENVVVIKQHLNVINFSRRAPAHGYENDSKNWTDEEFGAFRESMKWLENIIKNFE